MASRLLFGSGYPSVSRTVAMVFFAAFLSMTVAVPGAALLGTSPSAPAPVGGPALTGASSPSLPTPIQHVFLIPFENEGRSTVMSTAPFMASLANTYATPVNYYAVCHPSNPNYLSFSGGLSQQCASDAYNVYTNTNLLNLLQTKGVSWMDYQESMPKVCDTAGSDNGGLYVVRHNPWVEYQSIVGNTTLCDSHVVPLSQFNPNATPANFVYVTPNINDDGHNTNAAYASNWLQGWLTPLMSEPWFATSVFLLVFDEGSGTGSGAGYSVGGITLPYCGSKTVCGGNIWMTAVSPYTKGVGAITQDVTQYNLLSTMEWLLGVGNTGTGYDANSNFPAMKGLFNFGSGGPKQYTVTFNESGLPSGANWSVTLNQSGTAPASPHLVVEYLSGNSRQFNMVTNITPLLRPGDTVDLYDFVGPTGALPVPPARLNQEATQLEALLPSGITLDVNTGLPANIHTVATGISNQFSSVAATYEPVNGATWEIPTYNFATALGYFQNLTSIAHASGFSSNAYPTAGPLLQSGLQKYGWNYGQIAAAVDLEWIETQQYAIQAINDSAVWSQALSKLVSQFSGAGQPLSKLAIQITLGNNGHGTGTDPATAFVAIRTAVAMGIQNIYLWTAPGYESELATLLHSINRSMPVAPPPTFSTPGTSGTRGLLRFAGSAGSSQSSTISFTEPNGTYNFSVLSPTAAKNGARYLATPSSGSIVVNGANVAVPISYAPQYYVQASASPSNGGSVSPANGWYDAGHSASVLATPASGYTFAAWVGQGTGSYSGAANPASFTVQGPISEVAQFAPTSGNLTSVIFTETGLPAGTLWNVSLNGLWESSSNATVEYLVSNGSYDYAIESPVSGPNSGTRYVTTVTAGTLVVGNSSAAVEVPFTPEYNLVVSVSPLGSGVATPASGWFAANSQVNLSATAATNYTFALWAGTGVGNYTGTDPSDLLAIAGPLSEEAKFVRFNDTSAISLQVTGLPPGMNWSANVGGSNWTTDQTVITVPVSQGSVGFAVQSPIAISPTERYVAQPSSGTVNLSGSRVNVTVSFVPEALLVGTSSGEGVVTLAPAADGWYLYGASAEFTAAGSNGSIFAGWTGSGNGSYSGSENPLSVAVSGPIVEIAHFVPAQSTPPAGGSSAGGAFWMTPVGPAMLFAAILGAVLAMNVAVRSPRWSRERQRKR